MTFHRYRDQLKEINNLLNDAKKQAAIIKIAEQQLFGINEEDIILNSIKTTFEPVYEMWMTIINLMHNKD